MPLLEEGQFNLDTEGNPVRTSTCNDEAVIDDLRSGVGANIAAVLVSDQMGSIDLPEEHRRNLSLALNWVKSVDDYIRAHSPEAIPPLGEKYTDGDE